MKIKEALFLGKEKLKNIEIRTLDSEILLSSVLEKERSYLYTYPEKELNKKEEKEFLKKLNRRVNFEPIAYILGKKEFYGIEYKVNSDVLIPRPETECLVEEVIQILEQKENKNLHLLDLCCGSGAIGLTIKSLFPEINLTLSDVSNKALKISRKNAQNLNLNIKVISSNLFDNIDRKFEIIVSNPPYISEGEYQELSQDIKNYEPELALKAGEDGLDFYRRIISKAQNYLTPEGILVVEIGYKQGQAVKELFRIHGFSNIEVKQDLSGLDRFVIGSI